MSRCGCAEGTCPCNFEAGEGIVITGNGRRGNPFKIAQTPGDPETVVDSGFIDARDYNAVGDGVTDDTAALAAAADAAVATGKVMRIRKGSYLQSGVVYEVSGDWLWSNHGYSTNVNEVDSARHNNILVTAETPNTSPHNPDDSRVAISVTVAAKGSQHGTGIRSNLQNSSDDVGGTAFYGSAVSNTGADWSAALHGETRHGGIVSIGVNSESASYTTTGTMYGVTVINSTSGANPIHPLTGASAVACDVAIGQAFKSSSILTAWTTGIDFSPTSMRAGGITFKSAAVVNRHIWLTGDAALADIHLEGTSDYAIICGADYGSGNAIRLKTNNAIAFESTGTITLRHIGTPNRLVMASSGGDRISFEVSATPKILVSGTQVLGPRATGWSASTGTALRGAVDTSTGTLVQAHQILKALKDDLIAHGVIGS